MTEQQSTDFGCWIRSVVERFEGPLLRYAASITGDVERGQDVVQDTFLKLCREDRTRLDGKLSEWLFTVCRNRALDVRQKEKRMTTMTAEQAAARRSRDAEQIAAAETRETAALVLRLVAGLSDNQQEVVRLKFQNGLSYREIAAVTQLSVSNVGYLLHTAIQKVRKQLNVT